MKKRRPSVCNNGTPVQQDRSFFAWSNELQVTISRLCVLAGAPSWADYQRDELRAKIAFAVRSVADFESAVDSVEGRIVDAERRSRDWAEFKLVTHDLEYGGPATFVAATAHRAAVTFLGALHDEWLFRFLLLDEESVAAASDETLEQALKSIPFDRVECERLCAQMQREFHILSRADRGPDADKRKNSESFLVPPRIDERLRRFFRETEGKTLPHGEKTRIALKICDGVEGDAQALMRDARRKRRLNGHNGHRG